VRLRLDLAYDGTDFHGWATQPGLRTVQGLLQAALSQVLRVESVPVTCAGRTDTGVHARGQVVHLDVSDDVLGAVGGRSTAQPVDALVRRLNGVLPADVRVRGGREAPDGFDARFSALWRRYAYRIADDPAAVDPLTRCWVLARPRRLDVQAMNAGAERLVGEHDFAAFRSARSMNHSSVRRITRADWRRAGQLLVFEIAGTGFLRHMVRSLAGTLVEIGRGQRRPAEMGRLLAEPDRAAAGRTAPAHGLFLVKVEY
jgi:tRNA pseudouridine38-40 synthase